MGTFDLLTFSAAQGLADTAAAWWLDELEAAPRVRSPTVWPFQGGGLRDGSFWPSPAGSERAAST